MPDIRSLSTGTKVALGAAILLLIDTFFNWWSVDVGPIDVGENAWNGFWGILLGLLTIAFIAWLVVRVLGVDLPELPVPWRTITLVLGGLILLFALIKNIDDPESTIWSYLGVLLAAGCAAGAWLMAQESEPVATSTADTTSAPPTATATTPPAAEPTPPPAPPSTTPQPPAAGTSAPPSDTA